MRASERRAQGACGQWGLDCTVHLKGVQRRGLTLFRRMLAALFLGCCSTPMGSALACYLVQCHALPSYPRRSNGLALVAVANAKALQLPLPPKRG